MLFDFLTVTTGLYSRAILGDNINAVISYPLLANNFKAVFRILLFVFCLIFSNCSFVRGILFLTDYLFNQKILFLT